MSLLPPNASDLEKAFEAAMAVPALPVPLRQLWTPQTCPEVLLPWLAWALSVDEWDASWPVEVRRQVVARSIDVHRTKGTLSAVRRAVGALGGAVSIREWWETSPPGTPGTFTIVLALTELSGAAPTPDYVDATIRQIERAKPLSRDFEFALAVSVAGAIGVFGAARPLTFTRLDAVA